MYSMWKAGYLTILPQVNLVSNIGFGAQGTHTTNASDPNANLPAQQISFPLIHPEVVERNSEADLYTQKVAFKPCLLARIRWRAKAILSRMVRR